MTNAQAALIAAATLIGAANTGSAIGERVIGDVEILTGRFLEVLADLDRND